MNSRRRWAEYMGFLMGEVINICRIFVGNLKGGEHMQDIDVVEREVLSSSSFIYNP
jgi:hypothetical protein